MIAKGTYKKFIGPLIINGVAVVLLAPVVNFGWLQFIAFWLNMFLTILHSALIGYCLQKERSQ